jgi:DNA-binding NarL/FixJ family response regulator
MADSDNPMRVIIADDVPRIRDYYAQELARPDVEVVGLAATPDELFVWTRGLVPDAVLLDINFSGNRAGRADAAGIDAAEKLREIYPALGIVMFSIKLIPAYLQRITAIGGGIGYLGKDTYDDTDAIITALRRTAAGDVVIDKMLTAAMMKIPRIQRMLQPLTRRQNEVMSYVAQGHSNKAIANLMGVQESTVATTLNDTFKKLGITQSASVNKRVRAVITWLEVSGTLPAEPW